MSTMQDCVQLPFNKLIPFSCNNCRHLPLGEYMIRHLLLEINTTNTDKWDEDYKKILYEISPEIFPMEVPENTRPHIDDID